MRDAHKVLDDTVEPAALVPKAKFLAVGGLAGTEGAEVLGGLGDGPACQLVYLKCPCITRPLAPVGSRARGWMD